MIALSVVLALACAPVEGKGPAVAVHRAVDAAALAQVTAVKVHGPLLLRTGVDSADIVVTTEANIAPFVSVKAEGDTLHVGVDGDVSSAAGIVVEVPLASVQTIVAFGAAQVKAVALGTPLVINASATARVSVSGGGPSLTLRAQGASVVDASGFIVDSATVRVSGAAVVDVNAATNLVVEGSGVAQVRYRGAPRVEKSVKPTVIVEPKR